MGRRRKVIVENVNELITATQEEIVQLTAALKEKKAYLKDLNKQKAAYDKMMEEKQQEEEAKRVLELIKEKGITVDDLEKIITEK